MGAKELREAAIENEEVRSWKCASCDTMIEEEGKRYCRTCADYWRDVDAGMFDDP